MRIDGRRCNACFRCACVYKLGIIIRRSVEFTSGRDSRHVRSLKYYKGVVNRETTSVTVNDVDDVNEVIFTLSRSAELQSRRQEKQHYKKSLNRPIEYYNHDFRHWCQTSLILLKKWQTLVGRRWRSAERVTLHRYLLMMHRLKTSSASGQCHGSIGMSCCPMSKTNSVF